LRADLIGREVLGLMYVESFPPISRRDAAKLILGSMPGKASLEANQYYAHPRNNFWRIVGEVLDFPADFSYQRRCKKLTESGFAVWDVMKACFRSSSLDSDILESSVVPNDFEQFLRDHPAIRAIYFNGTKAEQSYRRYVLPQLPEELANIPAIRLPSTSPANASISYSTKSTAWRRIATD
jgi:TDG/mug DNA glycosylase family protein